jgi:ribA/ribD-fused uncharacterized protein
MLGPAKFYSHPTTFQIVTPIHSLELSHRIGLNRAMKILIFATLLLPLSLFACNDKEIKNLIPGIKYTCNRSIPELGEAWHDTRGLLWGSLVKGMDFQSAKTYCESFGARLPSLKEWQALALDLNYVEGSQRVFTILPDLQDQWLWTHVVEEKRATTFQFLSLARNVTTADFLLTDKEISLRCVKSIAINDEMFPETPAVPYQGAVLDFYREEDAYGEFSNFAAFPIFVDGEWWPTSEHYFQTQKYQTEALRDWVHYAPSPMEAANRGRNPKIPKRDDWEDVKDGLMEKALLDKYSRYPNLKKLLILTGHSQIFEHTVNDCYWADCGNRTGKNHLGLLLMKIRDSFSYKE